MSGRWERWGKGANAERRTLNTELGKEAREFIILRGLMRPYAALCGRPGERRDVGKGTNAERRTSKTEL